MSLKMFSNCICEYKQYVLLFVVMLACVASRKCFAQEQNFPTHWNYTAAVYEHRPLILMQTNWNTIAKTLDIYEQQIQAASKLGARLIVFPEDGIFGMNLNRSQIYQFLEIVPDPAEHFVNPCIDTVPTARNTIQRRLSCAARWYSMYIVANFGSIVFCGKATQNCPSDGHFQYNTNVVFDSEGTIVARYHKLNLYYEEQFDYPSKPEYSVFGSPLGTFGTFTCFDLLFKEPVLMLIESIGVVNIAFTTAWGNVLPEMFSIAVQEAFAIRMGVNLLAANVHVPEIKMQGSGIYSSNKGAIVYYNNDKLLSGGKLIVGVVDTPPEGPPLANLSEPKCQNTCSSKLNFTNLMEENKFTFVTLDETKFNDEIFFEHLNTKCYLNYTIDIKDKNDLFAFGIYEGLHQSSLNSFIQVCALVKCANSSKYSCGQSTRDSRTTFKKLEIVGQFSSHYIFPSLLVDGANPSKKHWNFTLDKRSFRGKINLNKETEMKPLLTAILYTRLYDKDHNSYENVNSKANKLYVEKTNVFHWHAESIGNMETFGSGQTSIAVILLSAVVIFIGVVFVVVIGQRRKTNGYIRL